MLKEFFEQGGFFMYVNLLCSVVALTLIGDRALFFLGKGAVNARAFLEQIRKLVTAGQIERAQRLCQGTDAPVALVARAGLSRVARGEAAVSTAIEEALTDAAPELKKRIAVLWSLANIATLIGLLGTINGLIGGFAAIGKAAADQRSQLLATRIAEAMNNTWLGLAIAASCMIGHLFLSGASKKQQHELESFALRLENLLADIINNPPTPAAEPAAAPAREREGREGREGPRSGRRDERSEGRGRKAERYRDPADEDEE